MATANTLYSNFVDAADSTGNIKNNKAILLAASTLANTIVRIGDTKFKAVYPFFGGIVFSHKFNFINPADTDSAFRLVFTNCTNSSLGFKTNAGNGSYARTFIDSKLMLSQNSKHLSIYSQDTYIAGASQFSIDMGSRDNVNFHGDSLSNMYSTTYPSSFGNISSAQSQGFPQSSAKGFGLISRVNATEAIHLRNGSVIIHSLASVVQNNREIILGACNDSADATIVSGNASLRNLSFASIGDGLTEKEAQFFSHQIKFIQGILGRQ